MDYKQALVILDLTEGFTEDELKKKYRELSMKWHPDKGGNEEMMKQINVAYETLKVEQQKETSNEQSNQYYEFKRRVEKVEVYRSKKNYTPGTLEHKYAEEINKVINEFCMPYPSSIRRYATCLTQLTDLFFDYEIKVLQGIPESFLKKYYSNINIMCPFDEYVQKLEKIKNEYKKIETTLDDVIGSIDGLLSNEAYEKILEAKKTVLKEVIDGQISLQDGVYKLRNLILQIITKSELGPKINETYRTLVNNFSTRILELNYKNTDEIKIATKVFEEAIEMLRLIENEMVEEDMLSILKKLTFKDKDELQKSDNDKLYITRDGNGKPEFVLKESVDGDVVNFYKKIRFYGETIAEKNELSKKDFYDKYMSLNKYLAQATFINKSVDSTQNIVNIQLYSLGNITIYLVVYKSDTTGRINTGYTGYGRAVDNYYTENCGAKYKDKQVLIEEIYQSFKELIEPLHKENTNKRKKYKL